MKKILLLLLVWGAGTISLLAQPVITTQPTNQIVLNGSNVAFSVAASGSGLLTYQWRFNGTNLPNNSMAIVAGGGTNGDGSLATQASLNYPCSVALDSAGDLFIADTENNKIRRVDTNGIITTVAGNGPLSLAADGAGNLWFCNGNCISKVDTNGIITTVAGNGSAGYSGDGNAATNASLNSPGCIALDANGNLFIADNNRIRRVDTNGIITTVAGNGSAGYSGDGGYAINATLNGASGVTSDSRGNLIIADYYNYRLRRVDTNGIITTMAGMDTPVSFGDGGYATNAALWPTYVTADNFGNIFVSDFYAAAVREINTNGIISSVVGVSFPFGLAVDSFENLYVADRYNNRIGKLPLLGPTTLNLIQVTTNSAGNYDVIISDANGSVTSSVVTLTVNVPVYLLTQPQGQTVPLYGNASFNVSAGGTLPLSYQWLFNGTTIPGALGSSLIFNVTDTNSTGTYSVIVTNNFGSVTSSMAKLTVVIIPPGIASQPMSQTIKYGSNLIMSVTASGSPPFSYQWFFNGVAMDSQTNAMLSLPNVATNQAGGYNVLVSSPYGSITSYIATLTISAPPIFTQQPTNQSLLAGNRALLTAGVSGVGPLTFQWQLNGTNLPNNLITTIAGNGTAGFTGDGGIATTGKIYQPYGVAADGFGNVFIADTSNNRTRKVSTNGVMTTVAGTGVATFYGDGGAATNARIYSPEGVSLDASGNLYIADAGNNRIRKVDTNGIITTVAGKSSAGFSGDGGAATNATLYNPYGIMVDTNGNLFIADTLNNRIRKVDTNGVITTIAGKSISTSSGDGGAATNAGLSAYGVTVDGGGNLLIADRINNRVRRVDAYGFITTIAGSGASTFSGDGGVATNAGMTAYGVAVDNYGDVYIADRSNNRIRRVDPYGIITTVAGTNGFGYSSDGIPATGSLLYAPSGIALDNYGRFLIADTGNNRIRRFGQGPTLVLDAANITNAGNYTLVVNSSFGSVTSAVATLTVLLPPAITSQPMNQTAGLGSNATFSVTVAGTSPLAYQWQMSGTNLPSQTNQSCNLSGVQWSDAGNYAVIITNNYGSITSVVATLTVVWPPAITNQPVSLVALAGSTVIFSVGAIGTGPLSYRWQLNSTNLPDGIISTLAGNGAAGYSGDGSNATNASMKPNGVTLDASGNIYIAETGNQIIRRVDTGGFITTAAGTGVANFSGDGGPATNGTLRNPFGVAFDNVGNLLIADGYNNRIREVDRSGMISTIAGNSSGGYAGDGVLATNTSLYNPCGIAVDTVGNLFFSDEYSYRIRKVNTNGIISTVAGGGANDPGKGGAATSARLNNPLGVAVDSIGNLYFADSSYHRIYKVGTNGTVLPFAGSGTTGFSGDGGIATNANLLGPTGIALDKYGNLFLVDSSRIRKVDVNGNITTVAGSAAIGFSGDGGSATDAALRNPTGVAVDSSDNLFIADNLNYRIRKATNTRLPNLVLNNIGIANAGIYQVFVTGPGGLVASSSVTLTVIVPPQQFTGRSTSGGLQIQFSGTPNYPYILQSATNLTPANWQPVVTNPADANGNWQFTDTNLNGSQKFYRAVSQ